MGTYSTGIVLINYFNDEEVISFIRKFLLPQTQKNIQIYVLNNGSRNGALKIFCLNEPDIQFEDPGKNLGYIGGFLHVFHKLEGRIPDLLVLSNTDIEIDSTLFESISALDLQEDEVMIGPSVISSRSGKQQNPFYENRISTQKLRMLNVAFSSYFLYALYQTLGILKAAVKGASTNPDSGNRHFIEKYYSELREAPFLFGEEIQFAEVAYRHNLKTVYCPSLKVKHHEHATTKLFKSSKNLTLLRDSIAFRLKKRLEEEA